MGSYPIAQLSDEDVPPMPSERISWRRGARVALVHGTDSTTHNEAEKPVEQPSGEPPAEEDEA